ncbi:hypothetical protein V2J09_014137 [Rumex salicifolius]
MGTKKTNSKSARKGKKAWRKISTEDVDDFNEQVTKDVLSGGPLHSVPSDSLFFLDKSTDVDVKRKIEKTREKVLRYESVLQKNPFVQAVPSSTLKKKKKSNKEKNTADMVIDASADSSNEDDSKEESEMLDVWSNEGYDNVKGKKNVKHSAIPAVEVEHAGCSFNPEPESHKDVLARAVADEMRKIYKNELGPKPIPLVAPGEIINEEDRYFLEADSGSEDNVDDETPTGDVNDITTQNRSSKTKRVTRVESNRRARRKVLQKAESESKKKEEEESKKRHLRRVVSKQERLKSCPPRLGKRKFEPAPVQVLLSEEISGSLRKLQGCCTLARDRFKSLEKRGLVVPSARKKSRSD